MITNKDTIIERIQNYLYSFYAKDIKTARDNEIYDCLCRYLMEIVGKKWVSSKKIRECYEVYILSFEYLPGSFLNNIIYKLGIEEEIKAAFKEMNETYNTAFDYDYIVSFDPDPGLGIGDMGVGSAYLINALTNNKIKATAYALRYESGNFKQVIENGMQREVSDSWLGDGSNWEHQKSFTNIIDIYNNKHKIVTYDMPVISKNADFVNTLRLFRSEAVTDVDLKDFSRGDLINAYEDYINNSSITQFLYVDDSTYEGKILRLKQEYFFSASAMRDFVRRYLLYYKDIEKIKDQTNVIINDIHPTLALVEFIRILTVDHGFSMNKAISYTREIFYHLVFSITDDSLERYPADEIRNMNIEIFNTILDIQNELSSEEGFIPFIEDGNVVFKNINMSLSKEYVFLSKALYEERKTRANISYTNMGTDRLMYAESNNPKLYELLADYGINLLKKDANKLPALIGDKDFITRAEEIKLANKKDFISYLCKNDSKVNPHSIFDMQLSIMHESKRQILNALAIAHEFYYLRNNSNAYFIPKTYIFSGKASQGYFIAKETIKFILALKKLIESDKIIREKIKIIFVENISVYDLRYLYPACDIYTNLTPPLLDNQNFDILNTSFNMSNILSGKGGIIYNVDKVKPDFYLMEDDIESYKKIKEEKTYQVNDLINTNEVVKYTTDSLLREAHENFPYDFRTIYDEIILYGDSFNTFYDLPDLVELRQKVARDYLDQEAWVNREIKNLIWANEFNFDHVIKRKHDFDQKKQKS